MKEARIGSDFDDFLKEEGLLAECEAGALKRAPAQLEKRIREALAEPAELATRKQFDKAMAEIANGR